MFEALHDGERILECILQNPNREKVAIMLKQLAIVFITMLPG